MTDGLKRLTSWCPKLKVNGFPRAYRYLAFIYVCTATAIRIHNFRYLADSVPNQIITSSRHFMWIIADEIDEFGTPCNLTIYPIFHGLVRPTVLILTHCTKIFQYSLSILLGSR